MIKYDPLWQTLRRKNISQYELIQKYHFSTGTLDALRKNRSVSMHTINTICTILDCAIEDVAVFCKDSEAQDN